MKKILIYLFLCITGHCFAQGTAPMHYSVSMEDAGNQTFHVLLKTKLTAATDFIMPVWTPGYYQKMDFAANVSNFEVKDSAGKPLKWSKKDAETWSVLPSGEKEVHITYNVKAIRPFVAASYLGTDRAYIIPGSLFMYIDGKINTPVEIEIKRINNWTMATGLDVVSGKPDTFYAPDFDVLYDSPILIGPLESLSEFSVKGIPHRFIGFKLGDFDKEGFVQDIKKIVTSAAAIFDDIPYKHYTFIAIGPGQGGIEHLNSTTISFNGTGLNTPAGKRQLYNFIAHEYFHHYNVKRIRPIELGPFDYKNGSRTNMLWVSEGLSVYYEYLVVKRAGLASEQDLLNALRANILAYETKPGRHYQTLTQASYQTWSDGPFGRTEDEVNKTISYYDKGPVVGMLLDFKIRQATGNKQSLDDVMRTLYRKYYQQKKRGFTEAEFRAETEQIAGTDLSELFDYTTTVKELDYQKYLTYAGLSIDTATRLMPERYTGLHTRMRNDSVIVSSVDYESPAWNAGIRSRQVILAVDGVKADRQTVAIAEKTKPAGAVLSMVVLQGKERKTIDLRLIDKYARSFNISRVAQPDRLQKEILESWLKQ